MSSGFQERHSQAFQSLASSTRSSSQDISNFPILKKLLNYIYSFQANSEESNSVDELASGTILCETVADFIADISIDQFHEDAKPCSAKADHNLTTFSRACEKIDIPRSCIADSNDFKEHDYAKIELMLAMFVIRGMAYGMPSPSDESLIADLKEYALDDNKYPEKTKDRNTCKRIVEVFRDFNNDKSEKVRDTTSESSDDELLSHERELALARASLRVSQPEAISDSDSERDEILKKSEGAMAKPIAEVDEEEDEEDDAVDEVKQKNDDVSPENSSDSDCDVDEVGATVVHNTMMPMQEEDDNAPEVTNASSASEDEQVDEVLPSQPQKEEDENNPEVTKASEEEQEEEEEQVDEVLPSQPQKEEDENNPEVTKASEEEDITPDMDEEEEEEQVDEVLPAQPQKEEEEEEKKKKDINDPEVASASEEEEEEKKKEVSPVLPPPQPEEEPKKEEEEPKKEEEEPEEEEEEEEEPEPEIITRSNNPEGYNENVSETPEQAEARRQAKREAREAAKKKEIEERVPTPPSLGNHTNTLAPLPSGLNTITQPVHEIKWYIVMLIVLLMILCVVGFSVCGYWLTKI